MDDPDEPTLVDAAGAGGRAAEARAIGRFARPSPLGAGGMGVVVSAEDPVLERTVAVKVLRSELAGDERVRRMFLDEARITGRLEHPGIVAVHELGTTDDGAPYFAMQRVRGRSLGAIVADATPADRPRLLSIYGKVCEAVAYAHDQGIIHRDLKPDNVMVGAFGEVLVLDWGLAERTDRVGPLGRAIVGTPAYMPPEQAAGREADARSDVYALGAILYQLLTLRRPSPSAADRYPPPSTVAEVPRDLEAIVLRAMADRPDDRYPSVVDLQADLEAYLDGRLLAAVAYTPLERARRWAGRHRRLLIASVAVALLVAALAGLDAWRDHRVLEGREIAAAEAMHRAIEASLAEVDRTEPGFDRVIFSKRESEEARAWLSIVRRTEELYDDLLGLDPATSGGREALRLDESRQRRDELVRRAIDRALVWDLPRAARDLLRDSALASRELEDRIEAEEQRSHQVAVSKALASHLRILGNDEEALETLSQSIARYPDEHNLRIQRAVILRDLGQFQLALADAERILASDPDFDAVIILRIQAQRALGRTDDLARSIEALERLSPPTANLLRARFARQEGRLEDALGACQEALASRPDGLASTAELALIHLERGDPAAADEALSGWLDRHGENASLLALRATARERAGDPEGALEDFERIRGCTSPTMLENHGNLLSRLERYEEAIEMLTEAIESLPGSSGPYFNRGLARDRAGDREGALRDIERAIALDPHRPVYLVERGRLLRLAGDVRGALADYDRAIALDPRCVAAYYNRSIAREAAGDRDLAALDLDRVLELESGHARAHLNRGSLRARQGDLDRAIPDLEAATRLEPDYWLAWRNLGAALRRRDPPAARRALETARDLAPAGERAGVEALLARMR